MDHAVQPEPDAALPATPREFCWSEFMHKYLFCRKCGFKLKEGSEDAGFSTATGRPLVRRTFRCPVAVQYTANGPRFNPGHSDIYTEGVAVGDPHGTPWKGAD